MATMKAPCGHPLDLFQYEIGPDRPIILLAGGWDGHSTPAIWCGRCGWVDLTPADHAALVLAGQASIPTGHADLAALLAVTPDDDQRRELFGLLQEKVGRGVVNTIWYAASDLERALLAGKGQA